MLFEQLPIHDFSKNNNKIKVNNMHKQLHTVRSVSKHIGLTLSFEHPK